MVNELKLDLACGDNKKEGFYGIDIAQTESTDCVMDLQQFPWDIASESAEEINCSHYLEHIKHDNVALDIQKIVNESNSFEEFKQKINSPEFTQAKDGFIKFINEVHRILKPGGRFTVVAPYYTSMRAFGDPTHTRYLGDFSFLYFNKNWRDTNHLEHYGIECDFDIKYSYHVTNDMSLKSEEVRNQAFAHEWNVIDDIMAELIKR
jgi:SAM-dependent methyltransferase